MRDIPSDRHRAVAPRWVASIVQAIALAWGVNETSRRLRVGRNAVMRLAAGLTVEPSDLATAIHNLPREYMPPSDLQGRIR